MELDAVQNSDFANLTHVDTVLNFSLLHCSPFWKSLSGPNQYSNALDPL